MSVVEEIKQRVDIVDLVSQQVALRRAGRSYLGLCPFHTEKTPSFHVDPQRQSWHCFGACGTGGDIFSFVMKKENCDFREALRLLGDRAGVTLSPGRDVQEDARRARLFDINETAAIFFYATLSSEGDEGARTARAYVDERRLGAQSIERFQIGYAPNTWEALTAHLRSRGFEDRELLATGVAVEGERGPYDRFRHRLMFPIRDERGRVVGFGGRTLPGEALGASGTPGKYINTPQSALFDKSALLYALDLAKDAIRHEGCAVIVEGYMDAIAAHECGHANVVASMGTALTERQVTLLKRSTRNIVLALDADAAGSEATVRGVQVVAGAVEHDTVPVPNWRGVVRMQETLATEIRVLELPEGRDPDDVIRQDPELWPALVERAQPVLDYLFEAAARRHDLTSPRGRSASASELLPMVAVIPDRIVQADYLQRLARMSHVDEATLRMELRRPGQRAAVDSPAPMEARRGARDRKEEFCLGLLIRYPELRSEGLGMDPELFLQSENRALFEAWTGWSGEGEPFEASVAPDLRPHCERLLQLALPGYTDEELLPAFRSTVWNIEQQRLRLEKRASTAVVADVAAQYDSADLAETARAVWQTGAADDDADKADPAQAFVDDTEVGLKVHRRLLDQQRRGTPPGEVAHER